MDDVRAAVLRDQGLRLEAQRDAHEGEVEQHKGAAKALGEAIQRTRDVLAQVQKDADEGKIPGGSEEVCFDVEKYAKKLLIQCVNQLDAQRIHASSQIIRAQGKVEAMEVAIKVTGKTLDQRLAAMQAREQWDATPEEDRDAGRRPLGARPLPSIKAQREAEGLQTPETVLDADVATDTISQAQAPESKSRPKKKRLRRPKAMKAEGNAANT